MQTCGVLDSPVNKINYDGHNVAQHHYLLHGFHTINEKLDIPPLLFEAQSHRKITWIYRSQLDTWNIIHVYVSEITNVFTRVGLPLQSRSLASDASRRRSCQDWSLPTVEC